MRMENNSDKVCFAKNLGKSIQYHRELLKLTQGQLADKANISRMALVNYEGGRRTPPVDICLKIANALNISLDTLVSYNPNYMEKYVDWFQRNGFEVKVLNRSSDNKAFYYIRESSLVKFSFPGAFFISEDIMGDLYIMATAHAEGDIHNLIMKGLHYFQGKAVAIPMMKLFHSPEYKAIRDELLSIDPFFFNSYSACAPKELKLTDEDLRSIEEIFSRCFPVISK